MDTNVNTAAKRSDAVLFYSVQDAMRVTGLSRISIHRRIKDKTIRAFKLGRRVLIPIDFIENLQAQGQTVLSVKEGGK